MSKFITLKENRDFKRLYSRGKYLVSPAVVTYVLKSRLDITRVGITASKKVGNAVKRNRARRVISEAYRNLYLNLEPGYDIVFVARGKTPFKKSTDLIKIISMHLKQLGVIK